MSDRFVVGVDLGGTNVRAAVFNEDGTQVGKSFSQSSQATNGTTAVVRAISEVIAQSVASAPEPPSAIGIAVPGHVDDLKGIVFWSPNFGYFDDGVFVAWRDIDLRDQLRGSTLPDCPIRMGNDANLAALGEYKFGVGKNNARCLVMLTVGTGIGGGVVLGSSSVSGNASGPLLLVGGNGGGGELGHMIIHSGGLDCSAGSYGALEGHCQRDAIVGRALHRLRRGRSSIIPSLVNDDLGEVSPKILFDAAEKGDEVAIQVWQEVGSFLGVGIANCINIFAPDVVAIGGQIAKAGKWLLEPARQSARDAAIPSLFKDASILQAERIDDAGLLGGAALALS
ncbi:MAG: ROK family protein [Fimbriimonadaceae bacterium]